MIKVEKILNLLRRKIIFFLNSKGTNLFEVCIDQGSIENLGRQNNLKKIQFLFSR